MSKMLIDEIDAEIKQDFWAGIAKKYKFHFAGALATIVIITSLSVWWKNYHHNIVVNNAIQYHQALSYLAQNNNIKANEVLSSLAESGNGGYKALALFKKAQLLLEQGKEKDALAHYKNLSENQAIPEIFRSFATYKRLFYRVEWEGASDELQTTIDQFIGQNTPWHFFAIQLKAIYLLKHNAYEEAEVLFDQLVKEVGTPNHIKRHAENILHILNP